MLYNIDIFYQKDLKLTKVKQSLYIEKSVDTALYIHTTEDEGDVLVFLTGKSEIDEAIEKFKKNLIEMNLEDGPIVLGIHSGMDSLQQDLVFKPSVRKRRKIIFSTNITQTSITLPNIRYVIDCGFVKQKFYDTYTGMDALLIVPISKAAAIQRSGRAGRCFDGKVYRLYSKKSYDDMQDYTVPEIQRSNLLNVVLNMKCMNIDNVINFDFIDKPNKEVLIQCIRRLYLLEALDDKEIVTKNGILMNNFVISPYLSRALIESLKYDCSEELLILSCILSTSNIFVSQKTEHDINKIHKIINKNFKDSDSDHLTLFNIYKLWLLSGYSKDYCIKNMLNYKSLVLCKDLISQVTETMKRLNMSILTSSNDKLLRRNPDILPSETFDKTNIIKSIACSYFINLARKNPNNLTYYYIGVQSKYDENKYSSFILKLDSISVLNNDHNDPNTDVSWVIYHELTNIQKPIIKIISKIEYVWIEKYIERAKQMKLYLNSTIETEERQQNTQDEEEAEKNYEAERRRKEKEALIRLKKIESAKTRYLERKSHKKSKR